MATRLFLRNTKVNAVHLNARDIVDAAPTGAGVVGITATTAGGTEIPVNAVDPAEVGEWISDQVDQPMTISGTVTFKMWLREVDALANCTCRVKVWKLTAGGSDVLTLIGSFDATVEASTSSTTALDFTGTPTSTVMNQRERFVVRLYVIPAPSQTMGGPYNTEFRYAASSSGTWCSWLEFTETFGLLGEGAKLYLRDSTLNGIAGFKDALPRRGTSLVTADVNTTAGGTDIQWTATPGGTVLAWISPRIADPVPSFTSQATPVVWPRCNLYCYESATTANAQARVRMWKRDLAGVETLFYGPSDMGRELTTNSLTLESWGATTYTTSFAEDDRIVIRVYLTNFGTMASGRTASMRYGWTLAGTAESNVIIGSNLLAFKAESEPNGSPARIPDGQSMGGVGN
jgi:hypothetical protein